MPGDAGVDTKVPSQKPRPGAATITVGSAVSIAFVTQGDAALLAMFTTAARQLVGARGKVYASASVAAAKQQIATDFSATKASRIGKVFFVGHGSTTAYFFHGKVVSAADGQFQSDEFIAYDTYAKALGDDSKSFLQALEPALMPPDNNFVVEMNFICCYAGTYLVDAVKTALDTDNATPSRFKINVSGYFHDFTYQSGAPVVLAKEVLGALLPSTPGDPMADPNARAASTYVNNSADVSIPPPYDTTETTK